MSKGTNNVSSKNQLKILRLKLDLSSITKLISVVAKQKLLSEYKVASSTCPIQHGITPCQTAARECTEKQR